MYIAICDDNPQDTEQILIFLEDYLSRNGYIGTLHSYSGGESLLKAFSARPYDIVFLDIYMSGMNGMETAAKLRKIDPDFALVFLTVSRDHAIESFAHRPSYYLTKPIRQNDLANALYQCKHVFLKKARYAEVVSDRIKIRIPLVKISYIEAFGKEILIHTTEGIIKTTTPLDVLEQSLHDSFLRCHRAYIVNLNFVTSIRQGDFCLLDGSMVPMRQRGRKKLYDTYAQFLCDRLFEVSL